MEIRPLRTEADYKAALAAVAPYFDLEPEVGSEEGDRFELLLMVLEAYEAKHHSIDTPDPVEAIKFRMDQAGLTPKDLRPMIGQVNRVYEVLNYTRPLTLPMIRRLNVSLGISADALIGEQKIRRVVASKSSKVASRDGAKPAKTGSATKPKLVKSAKGIQRKIQP